MAARIVLAYVIALPALVGLIAGRTAGYELYVTMASTSPGILQVFYDTGAGFSEQQSTATFVFAGEQPREYRLAIPPGLYRNIRIDPGTIAGRYTITSTGIRRIDGPVLASISAFELRAVAGLTTIERVQNRLVVDAPLGSGDPQLLFAPGAPVELPALQKIPRGTLRRLALILAASFVFMMVLERALRPFASRMRQGVEFVTSIASRRPRLAVVAAALVATVVAMYPLFFLGRSLVSPNNGGLRLLYDAVPGVPQSSDLIVEDIRAADVAAALYAFVPYSKIQRDAVLAGEWPLWNRYNAAGRPLWGQGQTFFLDPLHWLTFVAADPAVGWDLKFIAHRFLFALGIGLAAFLITGAWLPAALAAAAAPFVGVYSFRLSHPATFVLTYVPWAVIAWLLLSRARDKRARTRAACLLAVFTALIVVASPPKEAIGALFGVCLAGTLAIVFEGVTWRGRFLNLAVAIGAGILMGLVTAPHWLIFLDTLHVSATAYDVPAAYFATRPYLIALFLGPLAPGQVLPGLHAFGLVAIVAALTAPLRVLRMSGGAACGLAGGACLALAFGVVPGHWLVKIPLVGNIGHVNDVFITASVPLLLLAGAAGIEALRASGYLRRAAAAVTLLAIGWFLVRSVSISAPGELGAWLVCFTMVLAGMLPAVLPRPGERPSLAQLAAVTAVFVLVIPGGMHGLTGLESLDVLLVQPRPRVSLAVTSPAVRALHAATTDPMRTVGTEWALMAGSQALYDVEGLGGPDALALAKYDELIDASGIWHQGWLTRVGVHDVERLTTLLDMLNTGFLLTAPVPGLIPVSFSDVSFAARDSLKLGKRRSAWPRAFFTDGATTYADPADLLRTAAIHGPVAAIRAGDYEAAELTRAVMRPATAVVPARGYKITTNTTSFVVHATGPGLAVLAEAYIPNDFVATVNGRYSRYFCVNHAFKGVFIPSAGDWEVTFEYRPARWRQAWFLAAVGLTLLLVFAYLPVRHRNACAPG